MRACPPPKKKENRFSPINHPFCRAHGRDKTHRQTNTEILITRLSSWFGIHGSVLNWFKSYLSPRCFRVKCEADLLLMVHILLRWPPRLCPWSSALRHVLYTTSLSTLISSCSLNHHLYEDDTPLFLSFLPTHFDSSIDHLHNAIDRISSWMTANLLTLNSPKTEFLLIGAKHLTVESYTVVMLLTFILIIISIPSPLTLSFQA